MKIKGSGRIGLTPFYFRVRLGCGFSGIPQGIVQPIDRLTDPGSSLSNPRHPFRYPGICLNLLPGDIVVEDLLRRFREAFRIVWIVINR